MSTSITSKVLIRAFMLHKLYRCFSHSQLRKVMRQNTALQKPKYIGNKRQNCSCGNRSLISVTQLPGLLRHCVRLVGGATLIILEQVWPPRMPSLIKVKKTELPNCVVSEQAQARYLVSINKRDSEAFAFNQDFAIRHIHCKS